MIKYTLLFIKILALNLSACQDKPDSEVMTPVARHGKLQVIDNQLSNEHGNAIQLKGMSHHGPQWFAHCQTYEAFKSLATEWQCDIVRIAMYVAEDGYNNDPAGFRQKIVDYVRYCEELGIYCIIDWHILTPGNPNDQTYAGADEFFEWASATFKDKKHVLYEICNEPNGDNVTWAAIKSYAERIIPIIRRNDPNSLIISGTPHWSSQYEEVVLAPLAYPNIMYAFHFYAATHYEYDRFKIFLDKLPIFATEWGVSEANGDGAYDLASARKWIRILDGDNPGAQKISWAAWAFADGRGTSDNLVLNACWDGEFTNVKHPHGQFIMDEIKKK